MWKETGTEQASPVGTLAPDGFLVVDLDGVDLLVGPTGAFLVVDGNDSAAVEILHTRADQVHRTFTRHLQWVPFVHLVLLGDDHVLVPRTLAVTRDELRSRMVEGRRCIEPETLELVRDLVDRDLLRVEPLAAKPAGRR